MKTFVHFQEDIQQRRAAIAKQRMKANAADAANAAEAERERETSNRVDKMKKRIKDELKQELGVG